MLEHGGQLRRAAQHYGIALERWLDLSTGINPVSWCNQQHTVAVHSWARLPEDSDGLIEAAQDYYGAPAALPIAGSQAAILNLPRLRTNRLSVGVLAPSYAEHALRWRQAGHDVTLLTPDHCEQASDTLDVLVLVNPNNPTGRRFAREDLLRWHTRLASRGGWLVVDEAFIDTTPQDSLAALSARAGLIVLRSFGKFFGMAGARIGFVLASKPLLADLAEQLGPWTLAGPSRAMAMQALRDRTWQSMTRQRLQTDAARLAQLLSTCALPPAGGCELFQWVVTAQAARIHDALARGGLLTRLFDSPTSLRFGLPGSEQDWQRLDGALRSLSVSTTDTTDTTDLRHSRNSSHG